jgi:hypothetical protein
MAINNWANITMDPAIANKSDRADHRHTVAPGSADAGDLTVAWDSAKATTLTRWDSMVAAARTIAASRLPP